MRQENKGWLYLSLIMELGINMVLSLLFFLFLGIWLDKKFNLNGIFTIAGIVLGVLGGFYNCYQAIINIDKKFKKK